MIEGFEIRIHSRSETTLAINFGYGKNRAAPDEYSIVRTDVGFFGRPRTIEEFA